MKRGDFQTNGGAVRIVKADANVAAAGIYNDAQFMPLR